jgi:hypothetical protein
VKVATIAAMPLCHLIFLAGTILMLNVNALLLSPNSQRIFIFMLCVPM